MCPLCIIGQLIVNTTLDKTQVFGKIPTQNVTTEHEGRGEMCLIFTQLSPSFKLSNCRHFHSEKLFKTTLSPSNEILLPDRFLTIMGERGEIVSVV